jgi:uncharacterized protein (TIGR00297 family)
MSASILTPVAPLVLLLVAVPLHLAGAVLSFWRKSVNAGGALTGAILGIVIFVSAGPLLWLLFAAFVLSSTWFTRLRAPEKEQLSGVLQKSGRRDALQAVANGGAGMITAVLLRLTGEPAFAYAFAASLASANADTWASEIGVLSRSAPVSLVRFRPVPRGTSGGVTWLGLGASFGGALLIALLFSAADALFASGLSEAARGLGLVTGVGVLGALADSLLGCTVQAQYVTSRGSHTERRLSEGSPNTLVRGLSFVTNDAVNFLSTAAAAAGGALLFLLAR